MGKASPSDGTSTIETLTLTRPDGITDGRWAALVNVATLVVTGHAPWCDDHHEDWTGRSEDGWCERLLPFFCGEVEIGNGTTDGRTIIGLHLKEGISMDNLTVGQAAGIGATLDQAANLVKLAGGVR